MPSGERMTPRPCRAIVTMRRAPPTWSTFATCGRRALTNANVKSKEPTPTKITRLVIAHDGIFAVTTT